MKKSIMIIAAIICMIAVGGVSESETLSFITVPENLYPGRFERISYYAPEDGIIDLIVTDKEGNTIASVLQDYPVVAGTHHLTWDGTDSISGKEVPEGEFFLSLTLLDMTVSTELIVHAAIPKLNRMILPDILMPGEEAVLYVNSTKNGNFTLKAVLETGSLQIMEADIASGDNSISFFVPEEMPIGEVTLEAVISSSEGINGTSRQLKTMIEPKPTPTPVPTPVPTPTPYIPSAAVKINDEELNYWTLPIGDIEAEAAIWEVMIQPITVLDGKGDQRGVYKLRKEPEKSTSKENVIGEITFESQGVHVLETRDDGWSLVEVYNSSYGPDCASRRGYGNTDELLQGYVETSVLKVIKPLTEYGLLIDKLEQKMYIFQDGACIGSLLVSTGQPTSKQPWNETPSGEFLMVSRTGGFPAGNLWCEYGMRINGGCLIHEVPYIGDANTPADRRDYSSTVSKLGAKASHGCIRVQKQANEQGQNIKWLWNNIRVNTKVLIWDDTGRRIPYPDDETVVYYNPTGGKYFHQDQNCSSVKKRFLPLTETTYGALEELFKTPTACPYCTTIKTKAEIDALNALINPVEH